MSDEDLVAVGKSLALAAAQLRVPDAGRPVAAGTKRRRVDSTVSSNNGGEEREEVVEEKPKEKAPSVKDDLKRWGVNTDLASAIKSTLGVKRFFPFQRRGIERLLLESERDACISAPTGSGKTLVYVVPLIISLSTRAVRRLRALILVPSRDLALQVEALVSSLSQPLGLLCGRAVAGKQRSLKDEGGMLVKKWTDENGSTRVESAVDILVATPGRLVDHLHRTPGFSLEHLTWMIVDEADRLLAQSYQDWLETVYRAAHVDRGEASAAATSDPERVALLPRTFRKRRVGGDAVGVSLIETGGEDEAPLRRVLCSATLPRDPERLASLALRFPLHIAGDANLATEGAALQDEEDVEENVTLPSTLIERPMLVREEEDKIKVLTSELAALVQSAETKRKVICFASSVERATKLHTLLQRTLPSSEWQTFLLSSEMSTVSRAKTLQSFKSCSENNAILVASDVMARGIDVPNVAAVLSYDVPAKPSTYVHRAGRTARAGSNGIFIVFIRTNQAKHFRQLKDEMGLTPPKFVKSWQKKATPNSTNEEDEEE